MKILGMEFKISNWGLQSNKKFKLFADIALYTLPLYSGAVMLLSSSAPVFALWFNFIISLLVITIKAITKFTAEPVIEKPEDETNIDK